MARWKSKARYFTTRSKRRNDKKIAETQIEEVSIGSALSLSDQFDILVPIKIPDKQGREGSSDDSDISSITADEHQKMLKYFYQNRFRQTSLCLSSNDGWCCFTESPISEKGSIVGKKKKKEAKITPSSAPALSVDRTCDVSRSQFSLFDALSDEASVGEGNPDATKEEHMKESNLAQQRSWRKSIRKRRMPWSRKTGDK